MSVIAFHPTPADVAKSREAMLAERAAIGAKTTIVICPFCSEACEGVAFSDEAARSKADRAYIKHYNAEHDPLHPRWAGRKES